MNKIKKPTVLNLFEVGQVWYLKSVDRYVVITYVMSWTPVIRAMVLDGIMKGVDTADAVVKNPLNNLEYSALRFTDAPIPTTDLEEFMFNVSSSELAKILASHKNRNMVEDLNYRKHLVKVQETMLASAKKSWKIADAEDCK